MKDNLERPQKNTNESTLYALLITGGQKHQSCKDKANYL